MINHIKIHFTVQKNENEAKDWRMQWTMNSQLKIQAKEYSDVP